MEPEIQMQVRMPIQTRWLAVLLSLSLLPSLAWSQERPAALAALQVEDLTLEQAIALALNDNRLVKIAELDVGKVADNLAATRTFRLPSMNLYSLTTEQMV